MKDEIKDGDWSAFVKVLRALNAHFELLASGEDQERLQRELQAGGKFAFQIIGGARDLAIAAYCVPDNGSAWRVGDELCISLEDGPSVH